MNKVVKFGVYNGIPEVLELPDGIDVIIKDEDSSAHDEGRNPDGVHLYRVFKDSRGRIVETEFPTHLCRECLMDKVFSCVCVPARGAQVVSVS